MTGFSVLTFSLFIFNQFSHRHGASCQQCKLLAYALQAIESICVCEGEMVLRGCEDVTMCAPECVHVCVCVCCVCVCVHV